MLFRVFYFVLSIFVQITVAGLEVGSTLGLFRTISNQASLCVCVERWSTLHEPHQVGH